MLQTKNFGVIAVIFTVGLCLSGYLFLYQQIHVQRWTVLANHISYKGLQYLGPLSVNNTQSQNNTSYLNTTSLKTTKYFKLSTIDVSQFVSVHESVYGGRRLGNQLFDFAAVLFVAELTGRRPVLRTNKTLRIESVFQLNLERVGNLCPCYRVHEVKALSYDEKTEKEILKAENKSILLSGFRQSWKYTTRIEQRLRRQLVFNNKIQRFAEDFLQSNTPPGWKKVGFVRVGIHARRGDVVYLYELGYTVPNATYFEKAMKFFIERFVSVQFIAMSDDRNWTIANIVSPINISSNATVNVTYSQGYSPGRDLALLSMCDHVIMSTGTFGWWGAWLAKGTTIYYKDWPLPGSDLHGHFTKEDFFPPSWIAMGD